MKGAHKHGAHIRGTHVRGTHIRRIHIRGTHTRRTQKRGTHVRRTHIKRAHIRGTHIRGRVPGDRAVDSKPSSRACLTSDSCTTESAVASLRGDPPRANGFWTVAGGASAQCLGFASRLSLTCQHKHADLNARNHDLVPRARSDKGARTCGISSRLSLIFAAGPPSRTLKEQIKCQSRTRQSEYNVSAAYQRSVPDIAEDRVHVPETAQNVHHDAPKTRHSSTTLMALSLRECSFPPAMMARCSSDNA